MELPPQSPLGRHIHRPGQPHACTAAGCERALRRAERPYDEVLGVVKHAAAAQDIWFDAASPYEVEYNVTGDHPVAVAPGPNHVDRLRRDADARADRNSDAAAHHRVIDRRIVDESGP